MIVAGGARVAQIACGPDPISSADARAASIMVHIALELRQTSQKTGSHAIRAVTCVTGTPLLLSLAAGPEVCELQLSAETTTPKAWIPELRHPPRKMTRLGHAEAAACFRRFVCSVKDVCPLLRLNKLE